MDLIKYIGVNAQTSGVLDNFRQFNTSITICLPNDKNDINEITKASVEVCNMESEIIKTPVGVSFEGQVLTGFKLLIIADMNVKMEYSTNDPNNPVNTLYISIPISSYVVIDEDFDDYLTAYPSFQVEDIYCKKLSEREFYLNVNLISLADIF